MGYFFNERLNSFLLQISLCFPYEGLVYDYRLDDAGISNCEDEDEDEQRKVTCTASAHMLYTWTLRYAFCCSIHSLPVL